MNAGELDVIWHARCLLGRTALDTGVICGGRAKTILDEIHDIRRFGRVQDLASYVRPVKRTISPLANRRLAAAGRWETIIRTDVL